MVPTEQGSPRADDGPRSGAEGRTPGAALRAGPLVLAALAWLTGADAGLAQSDGPLAPPEALDQPLSGEEEAWARTAWAYFAGPPPAEGAQLPAPSPSPAGAGLWLVPARSGTPVATMWSVGDQLAALVIVRRLEIIGDREFDQRLSGLLGFLNSMPLAFGELPNRLYATDTGAGLGEDLQAGVAGWSSVDTGRLLIWLRIVAEERPEFASYIRSAVARLSVCGIRSDEGRLQGARPDETGTTYLAETARGYDAYAVQGYRAWGLAAPLPGSASGDFEVDVDGVRFPLAEDVTGMAPVMTTPPAYLGLEFAFEALGPEPDEDMAGGRGAEDLLAVVHDLQARRFAETGVPTARADFRRSEEPFTVYGTVLANGFPWSTVDPAGAAQPRLALLSTRAAFGLDVFFEGDFVDTLGALTRELQDPNLGWYEGRYEDTGAYELTRTSATNAFVLEAIAYRHIGPLFPAAARPEELGEVGPDCRLPLAAPPDTSGDVP
jgi:hypothetical protein